MDSKLSAPSVLITSGPTAVAIDDMRIISNQSTGEMGRLLANAFLAKGYSVTLLEGRSSSTDIVLSTKIILKKFFLYDELDVLLKKELQKPFDVVIHAAAVSDFALSKPLKGKVSSDKGLTLKLYPTKKIVNSIKKISPDVFLVGFKLETKLTKAYMAPRIKGLIHDAGCDMVVANSLSHRKYKAFLVEASGKYHPKVNSKESLVKVLISTIDEQRI